MCLSENCDESKSYLSAEKDTFLNVTGDRASTMLKKGSRERPRAERGGREKKNCEATTCANKEEHLD